MKRPVQPLAIRVTIPHPDIRRALLWAVVLMWCAVGSLALLGVFAFSSWNDAEELHSRWAPSRLAERLVFREMEARKTDHGRYPERLGATDLGEAASLCWHYRVSEDGSDYELWCRVPRDESRFDALVFSPDGVIGDDWPGTRPSPGRAWTMVEHAELAPADRWRNPVNP